MTRRHGLLLLFTFLLATTFPLAGYASANPPVIVCFGDSLTAGHGVEAAAAYPSYLQQLLTHHGYSYHVVNAGIDGNTSKDGTDRLKDVLALHPQIVIVEFGGNDGLRGLPLTSTQQNMDQIISTLLKARIAVALAGITLPPNYGPDYIQQFNGIYSDLARKYHLPLLPFLLKNVYGTPGSMQEDGIHATVKGNQQVAANVFELIRPLLKK
ncbi:arylesterase [Acidobacterium sp. S8]|uniref:arylesterase n=1 Tax=Acidobacterium sp. S8 TaxID=1641854 RepID=UPI00131D499D|nr:arylesterase [Acidobacterium sp. S8]